MAGWFVADSDGYGVAFVAGEDQPPLEPGQTADYYGVSLDEQELRAYLRRNIIGRQIGVGDGETTVFRVLDAPVARGTFTLYQNGNPVDPESYQWFPESGALIFEDPETIDPDDPDAGKNPPPP